MWTPAVSQSSDQLTVEQTVCTDGAEGGWWVVHCVR